MKKLIKIILGIVVFWMVLLTLLFLFVLVGSIVNCT